MAILDFYDFDISVMKYFLSSTSFGGFAKTRHSRLVLLSIKRIAFSRKCTISQYSISILQMNCIHITYFSEKKKK